MRLRLKRARFDFLCVIWQTKFPTLKRIGESIRALPFVEAASPEKQPDAIV